MRKLLPTRESLVTLPLFVMRTRNVVHVLFTLVLSAGVAHAVDESKAVVIVPVADMYSNASDDADVVSQAILGTNVEVLEESSGWEKIRTDDQYAGWVRRPELRLMAAGEHAYATSGRVALVSSLSANLYRETNATIHRPVVTVPFETRLEIVAQGQGDD